MSECQFPDGFLWGAATSAYQVEGAAGEDGRGESIWDRFCREPGRIENGDTGDIACDHYRRWRHDIDLMRRLGLTAYRFSVAWPRVFPSGKGQPNSPGLAFYDRLVDGLLAAGIQPLVTLYHWDLPAALQDRGGWTNRDTAYRFRDYAAVLFERLGDRVDMWLTVNEPYVAAMLGHALGMHAPGLKDLGAALKAAHHLLLGHGLAVDALRAALPHGADAEIAITLNPYPVVALGDSDADRDAARRVDGLANRLWSEPVLHGAYPEDVLDDLSAVSDLAHIRDGDLAQIARPIDALGVNYYRRHHVRHESGASAPPSPWPGSPDVAVVEPPGAPTSNGWAVEPDGLTEVLVRLSREGAPPLYVHENGAAFADVVDEDGRVHDEARRRYIADHLAACLDALDAGVDLRGYMVWSLLDNFEWAEGYTQRFGIVHVDFATQRRTPKDSALWYAEVVRTGTLAAEPARPAGDGRRP